MTLASTKIALERLLAEPSNKVIALTGPWGTGKSHMWRSVRDSSLDQAVKDATYASLFGINSVRELKARLVRDRMPGPDEENRVGRSAISVAGAALKVAAQWFKAGAVLDDVVQVVWPLVMKDRFVVFDDIERKLKTIAVEELLGLIDDCVQNLSCRVLLIMNSDALDDAEAWETFREKVVDHELRLDTLPSEAMAIAASLVPTRHAQAIGPVVDACGVANIRVIGKSIRVVNQFLEGQAQLPRGVLQRVVPSTIVLTLVHCKALEDGPPIEFVAQFNSVRQVMERHGPSKADRSGEELARRDRWSALLNTAGIAGADEFEPLVIEHLRSGQLDAARVADHIRRYFADERHSSVKAVVQDLLQRAYWNVDEPVEDILKEMAALIPSVDVIDPFTVSDLMVSARELCAASPVPAELLTAWLHWFDAQEWTTDDYDRIDRTIEFGHKLDPAIAGHIDRARRPEVMPDLVEVCKRINKGAGYSASEAAVLAGATIEQYTEALAKTQGEGLHDLLAVSLSYRDGTRQTAEPLGTESFLAAARAIVGREPGSRRGKVIREAFERRKLDHLLGGDEPIDAAG